MYGEADVALADDLARRTAVAIENARNYQEARAAEARMRQQAERIAALAEASQAFAMARLDLEAVLKAVARRVAELLGDVCSVRLISDDGTKLIPVAFHHTIPEAYEVFRTLPSFGVRGVHEGTVGQVMSTGQPLLIANRPVEEWRSMVLPDWIPYVERFGMHSLVIVPLRASGTTIGTLGLWREKTPEPFTLDDQQFVQDLADRAGLAVDNARLYSDAQAAIAARDEFLSVAAHELKTPVTSLRGYAQLLVRQIERGHEIPPDRLQAALKSIDRQTWRLSALISQLLDTSRIHSGELLVQPSSTAVDELINELVEHARTLSDTHEIVVDCDEPLVANVDALRIEQVLTNLIENAIKYSPAGGHVRVVAAGNDGWLRIEVEDSGPGIPEGERERIFERFYQIGGGGPPTGMGLGLFISRQIAALHGGTIDVEAPDSGGTRFVLRLPAGE
jgi:signal transduction histidine kinase